MNDDLEITGHGRGVVVTTICCLRGIDVGDFGVKDTHYVPFLTFTLGFISYTMLEISAAHLVA